MVKHKYGTFEKGQISATKEKLRKKIYFLLLIADPSTADNYDVDVVAAFKNVQHVLDGYNSLVGYPKEVVTVASLLEKAMLNYQEDFDFQLYRKLVLDAGREVLNIKEVDDAEP